MLRKLLLFFIFVIVASIVLLISIWTNLSPSSISGWLEYKINSNIPRQFKVEIGEAQTRISGLDLYELQVQDNVSQSTLLTIQSFSVTINPVNLLIFQEIDYRINIYQGIVAGTLDLFPELNNNFEAKDIELNRNITLRKSNIIQSNPVLNAKGSYSLFPPYKGNTSIRIDQVSLSGKSENTNIPFELPDAELSNISGEVLLDDRLANISLSTSGDIKAEVTGSVQIDMRNYNRSNIDLVLKGKLSADFESKLGFMKGLVNPYKDNSGDYGIKFSGNISRPRISKP